MTFSLLVEKEMRNVTLCKVRYVSREYTRRTTGREPGEGQKGNDIKRKKGLRSKDSEAYQILFCPTPILCSKNDSKHWTHSRKDQSDTVLLTPKNKGI